MSEIKTSQQKLDALDDSLVQDIMNMSDDEIMAEALERLGSPEAVHDETERLRGVALTAIKKAQWKHDVADYGDNAFLMWKLTYKDKYSPKLDRNDDISHHLRLKPEYPIVTRKNSAALPFDLERAKAGDEILAIDENGKIHRAIYQGYYEETSGVIIGLPDSDNERAANVCKSSLRMKYPPKANNASPKN